MAGTNHWEETGGGGDHRHTGPAPFRGAEVSCQKVSPLLARKSSAFFARKWVFEKF